MKNFTYGIFFGLLGFIVATPVGALATTGYVGVGVTIQQTSSGFVLSDVLANGPAARAGVLIADTLLQIDAQPLQNLSLEQVITLMRGNVGTTVNLTLLSRGSTVVHTLGVVREYIQVPCFIEGFVDLRIQGDDRYGTITGWIGNDYANWSVNYGRISANFKGEYLNLQLYQRSPGNFELTGSIHNQYVNWQGYGGHWGFYQSCIPQ